jgi:hypothetical protein
MQMIHYYHFFHHFFVVFHILALYEVLDNKVLLALVGNTVLGMVPLERVGNRSYDLIFLNFNIYVFNLN